MHFPGHCLMARLSRNALFTRPQSPLTVCLLLVTLVATTGLAAEETLWHTDFEAAKKTAQEENKDLLLDFTGSDWCGWCVKLKNEVLSKEAFLKKATEKFVLVELDFPKRTDLPKELQTQNDKLSKKYDIRGFPTIILMDSQGRPYAQTGYQKGGPEAYMEHLNDLRSKRTTRDKLLNAAEQAEGLEKAKLLDKAYSKMQQAGFGKHYQTLAEEIIALDAQNELGLKHKYQTQTMLEEIERHFADGEPDKAIKQANALVDNASASAEAKQQALYWRAASYDAKEDREGVLESLRKAKAAAPNSQLAKRIDQLIGRYTQ